MWMFIYLLCLSDILQQALSAKNLGVFYNGLRAKTHRHSSASLSKISTENWIQNIMFAKRNNVAGFKHTRSIDLKQKKGTAYTKNTNPRHFSLVALDRESHGATRAGESSSLNSGCLSGLVSLQRQTLHA